MNFFDVAGELRLWMMWLAIGIILLASYLYGASKRKRIATVKVEADWRSRPLIIGATSHNLSMVVKVVTIVSIVCGFVWLGLLGSTVLQIVGPFCTAAVLGGVLFRLLKRDCVDRSRLARSANFKAENVSASVRLDDLATHFLPWNLLHSSFDVNGRLRTFGFKIHKVITPEVLQFVNNGDAVDILVFKNDIDCKTEAIRFPNCTFWFDPMGDSHAWISKVDGLELSRREISNCRWRDVVG